jgi:hypothetical protein
MENSFSYTFNFHQLPKLFRKKSGGLFILEPPLGSGSLQVIHLARGLEAWFWNCSFNHEVELFGNDMPQSRNRYFTLLCFLDTHGFKLSHADTMLGENIRWNTAFLSNNCPYKMEISPKVYGRCVSISFSETWFSHNIAAEREHITDLHKKLTELKSNSRVGTLNDSEQRLVQELMSVSWKKWFGTFYIKSLVLRIVSDVLYRIMQRESFSINHLCLQKRVPEIEKYLQ